MNHPIHLTPTGKQYLKHQYVGVLDTPCYPARYYVGYVFHQQNEWIPTSNETNNFYRTIQQAENAYLRII